MSAKDAPLLLEKLAAREPFPRMMNIEVIEIQTGYAKVRTTISPQMLNIHGTTHGGALFGLVDEAFELASNSHGTAAVALNMNITYFTPTAAGDVLTAEAKEIFCTNHTATYQIEVIKGRQELIAACQAVVYRKKDPLPEPDGRL